MSLISPAPLVPAPFSPRPPPQPVEGGWEARVEARTKDGSVIGAAEAQCLRAERNWGNRDDFALRSMAQTRATAKCLRMPLGFVMSLSGFEVTPAEEMVSDHPHKPTAPPTVKPTPPKPVPCATEEQKAKLIKLLEPARELATEFLCKLGWILPTKTLEDLELRYVPSTIREMGMLKERMAEFGNGEQVGKPYEPHWETEAKPAAAVTPVTPAPKPKSVPSDQSWRDVIVTVPRKGMKKMEYEAHPDTIGSLFDLRHGNDEEAESARRRLWWLAKEWKPEPREFKGKVYQPSQADFKAREALDAFLLFFEREHPNEKL